MKVIEALRAADDIRPNALLQDTKLRWLSELDGKIAVDVMLMDIAEAQNFKYTQDDFDSELLAAFPHDDVYVLWLVAQIDFANGELNRYQDDKELFNAAWGEFVRWFARTYEPAQKKARDYECTMN